MKPSRSTRTNRTWILLVCIHALFLFTHCDNEKDKNPNPKPVASFEMSSNQAKVGESIYFENTTEHGETYEWYFGDTFFSAEENPVHAYQRRGEYTIRLNAINSAGVDSSQQVINIVTDTLLRGNDCESLTPTELLDSPISSIQFDVDGTLWVVASSQLLSFDGSSWNTYTSCNSGIQFRIDTVFFTDGAGISESSSEDIDSVVIYKNPSNINNLTIDDNGTKWIALGEASWCWQGNGITSYDGTNWTNYNRHNSGLSEEGVQVIAVESQESIWIGTGGSCSDGIIYHVFNGNWIEYNASNSGIPETDIYTIIIDPTGMKWIGTGDGLVSFDGTNWTTYNTTNSQLPHDVISILTLDEDGSLWIGSWGGLTAFDRTNWTQYNTTNSGLPNFQVEALEFDSYGTLWVGTRDGLTSFNGSEWQTYNTSNSGLIDDYVTTITSDQNGTIWVGTWSGLVSFDGTTWTTYP